MDTTVWIPDKTETFVRGKVAQLDNDIATVCTETSQIQIPESQLQPCNPQTFDKIDDMSELTFLNEPSVLYNLERRYEDDLIYTYSGLFLVAINPYANLPLYTNDYVRLYHGSPKHENKPHIFATADLAYQLLLTEKKDQSVLVTGESGAGKTENTKKILQYLAAVTAEDKDTFEKQILQSNPILESFGNAQTTRNNNSSRFGKFIKIEFSAEGKINGAHIEWYLLEKSRVVQQTENERNYHIFYQLLKGLGVPELEKLGLEGKEFGYLMGNWAIPGVDDIKNFRELQSAFSTVGLSHEEVWAIYEIVAIILHLGDVEFASQRAEKAQISSDTSELTRLLGCSSADFATAVTAPKVKAGREFVSQAKSPQQAKSIIDSLAKSLFERLFGYIIDKINENLDHGLPTANYIGLLDIAGFEIFKENSFEQLCINYTNEKLQQFFNHHMFVLEQNEYAKENIKWDYIDFGATLQQTIDLIDKGILPMLDEESILPKGNDASFYDKILSWEGKSTKFKRSKNIQSFVIKHYAGDVDYSVTSWLSKNRDPLNEFLSNMLVNSSNKLVSRFFKATKSGSFKTVANRHKEHLALLLQQLGSTTPHFVRCIIPNNNKRAHDLNKDLVLDQLRCNGVLEGIRIAREGYPNRIFFKEFYQRYRILSSSNASSFKANCEQMLPELLKPEQYKIGLTKIFFKAGVLADLESRKDGVLGGIVTKLATVIRGKQTRQRIGTELKRVSAAQVLGETIRTYNKLNEDPWYNMYIKIKPLLTSAVQINRAKQFSDQLKEMESQLSSMVEEKQELVKKNDEAAQEIMQLKTVLSDAEHKEQTLNVQLHQCESDMAQATKLKDALESEKQILQSSIVQLEEQLIKSRDSETKFETSTSSLATEVQMLKKLVAKKDDQIKELTSRLNKSDETLSTKLAQVENNFLNTSKKLRLLITENKDLHDSLTKMQQSANDYSGTIRSKESVLDSLRSKLEQQKHETLLIRQEKDELQQEHIKVVAELGTLKEDLSKLQDSYNQLEEQHQSTVAGLRDQIFGLEKQISRERESNVVLSDQLSKFASQRVHSRSRSLTSTHDEDRDMLLSRLKTLEARLASSEFDKQQLNRQLKTQGSDEVLEHLKKQLYMETRAREILERQAQPRARSLEDTKLREDVSNLEVAINRVSQERDDKITQLQELQSSFASLAQQNDLLGREVKAYKSRYESCLHDLDISNDRLHSTTKDFETAKHDVMMLNKDVQALEQTVSSHETALDDYEQRIRDLEDELGDKNVELERNATVQQRLEDEIVRLNDRLSAHDNHAALMDELQDDLSQSLRQETEMKKEIESLKTALEDARVYAAKQDEIFHTSVKKYEAELADVTEDLTAKAEKLQHTLEELNSVTAREQQQMGAAIKALEADLRDRDAELTRLSSELDALHQKLQEETEAKISLHQENDSLGKHNEQLLQRIELLQQNDNRWTKQQTELEDQLARETEDKFELVRTVKSLEREASDLRQKNEKQGTVIELANRDRDEFMKQIEELQNTVHSYEKLISKQEVSLSLLQRDTTYYKARVEDLEGEMLSWKNRYDAQLSMARSTSDVFI